MMKLIYIGLIIIISIWTIYLYFDKDQDYRGEIMRINNIESHKRRRYSIINNHRLNSTPCYINNLNNPRDCYIRSNYNCKWNQRADRCNQIE